jgi:hypothetical protein
MTTTTNQLSQIVLAFHNGVPSIVSVHASWGVAIDAWTELDDARRAGEPAADFYAVRDSDDALVAQAAALEAGKLGKTQRHVLQALTSATAPGHSIKPGNRKRGSTDGARWGRVSHLYTGDIAAPARKLRDRGLVTVAGLDFAPKIYTVTPKGRIVAAAI